jgi:hypothetical protein
MTTWDPNQYLKFADHRLRPALDLLARIRAEEPGAVYDLGCGAGTHCEERPADAPQHEHQERDCDPRRRLEHRRSIRKRMRIRSGERRRERETTDVEPDRGDRIGPFAGAKARDRAEDACLVDIGAHAEQHAAEDCGIG